MKTIIQKFSNLNKSKNYKFIFLLIDLIKNKDFYIYIFIAN